MDKNFLRAMLSYLSVQQNTLKLKKVCSSIERRRKRNKIERNDLVRKKLMLSREPPNPQRTQDQIILLVN